MKYIFLILSLLTFVTACDFTSIKSPVCAESKSDIRRFAGNYKWDMGEGFIVSVVMKRFSRGEYTLMAEDGTAIMNFTTCRVGRRSIAESLIRSDDGESDFLALFTIQLSRRNTLIKTLQFDEKTLNDNGVDFIKEETRIEDIPMSAIDIDNSNLEPQELVNLSVSDNGKEPFYIELTR